MTLGRDRKFRASALNLLFSGVVDTILFSDQFGSSLGASWTNRLGTFETNSGKARCATKAVDGNNLTTNNEFTTNTSGWTSGNSAVLTRRDYTVSPDIDPTGGADNFGLEVANGAANNGQAVQNVTSLPGATYVMSARCYTPSANTGTNTGRITIRDGGVSINGTITAEDVWQSLSATRVAVNASLGAWLALASITPGDLVHFDAVTFQTQYGISTFDPGQSNLDITLTITTPASGTAPFGIILRYSSLANYWLFRIRPGTAGVDFELVEVNAGVSTVRASADIDWSVSTAYALRLQCYGNKYRGYVAGVLKLEYTDSGNFLTATTPAGLLDSAAANGLFDDLEVRPCSPFDVPAFSRVSERTLWSTSSSHDWLGRPLLADNGTNFICIYRSAVAHGDSATSRVHIRSSADEGATWSDEDKTIGGASVTGFPISPAVSAVDVSPYELLVAPNGNLLAWVYHAEGTNGGTYQYRSTDGGATWSSDGRVPINENTMIGGLDHCIVGTDIYMVANYDAGGNQSHPWTIRCYKSSDNGATWSALTDVDAVNDGNESGICNPLGNRLVVLARDSSDATTYLYVSENLGSAWSSRVSVSTMGVFHRPMIRKFGDRLFAVGRDYVVGAEHTVVYHSIDGVWWDRQFFPDADSFVDTGYCSVLQKSNGQYYMLSYAGTTDVASIVEYIFSFS